MDYGKYKYQDGRQPKGGSHKEIRFRPKTSQHDLDFKARQAIRFLTDKQRVRVSIVFRGREIVRLAEGRGLLDRFVERLTEHGRIVDPAAQNGRRISCVLAPIESKTA